MNPEDVFMRFKSVKASLEIFIRWNVTAPCFFSLVFPSLAMFCQLFFNFISPVYYYYHWIDSVIVLTVEGTTILLLEFSAEALYHGYQK